MRRSELAVEGFAEPIVAGFRRDGAASFFFGQQTVYQFNTANELRRGFLDGHLLKAENGKLVQLTRQRQADAVNLLRHDLTDAETRQVLSDASELLLRLRVEIAACRFRIIGQVPGDGDIAADIRQWLERLPAQIVIAKAAGLR
jgi:hypothetical protein